MFGGYALSPILCSAILMLAGKRNITEWRWIFLLEGLLTIVVGLLMFLFLPGSPMHPYPLLSKRLSFFSDREIFILKNRLTGEERTDEQLHPITKQQIKESVLQWRRYHIYLRQLLSLQLGAR